MSFDQLESSQEQGQPIELYKFTYGPGDDGVYCYTNADQEIGFGGDTYIPVPIGRDAYHSGGKTDKDSVIIRVPVTTDLAGLFTSYPPTQPVTVVLYAGHFEDGDYLAIWSGKCLSAAKEGQEQVLTCESMLISLKRPGLRRNYQYGCPYVLFGPGCNASEVAATKTATVDSVVDGKLVLDGDWYAGEQPTDYIGGMIKWTSDKGNEARTIIRVDAEGRLQLIGPIRGLEAGDSIRVIKGCDHLPGGCRKHDNILNYGGQPWIPLKNPVKYHPFW